MDSRPKSFSLSIFDKIITVNIESIRLISILKQVYGSMVVAKTNLQPHLEYTITENLVDQIDWLTISRPGIDNLITDDIGEFIFFFEKDMTIELQKIRHDLLFIHSAALEYESKGLLLVAPSGTGKSTTAWAMINSGFTYLSDELAPVDINTMSINPYPHALCLKSKPPVFELPDDTLYTSQTIHVPLKSDATNRHTPLRVIFFLEFVAGLKEPEILPINAAEAAANLFANSLNILAHSVKDDGLNVAITLAKHVRCYKLKSNELEKTCRAVKLLMNTVD